VAAVRPLRVEELAEVLAVDFDTEGTPKLNPDWQWQWEDQEEAVLSVCSSLVMVVKYDNSRIVQFSHYSVKEFLTSDRLAEASGDISRYHIPLESAHTILAQACLGVLLQLDDQINRDTIENFPLAQYAAERWVDHARFGNVASRIKAGMECLFDVDKPHFATWRWIYNRERHSSMSTMYPEKPEQTPLYYAAKAGFHDLTKNLLTGYPEDVHAKGGYEVTPLHAVARLGYHDLFSLLVKHFPDVNISGPFHQTPLHRASRGGHLEIGQRLLDLGADVDAPDEDDWTPLYIAAIEGHLDIVQMLLERGAAINTKSDIGNTPLHVASASGNTEVVQLLLERGADPNVYNNEGHTPFKVASSEGLQEIAQLLFEYSKRSAKK
jgi:Ankyrin repeats (3 copies)/Ankyrin repeats (many copies)